MATAYTKFTKIQPAQLIELRRLCANLTEREFSDAELISIAERIIRFLLNSQEDAQSFDLK